MLVVDTENVYVFVGKLILFHTDVAKLDEAAVAFLESFYLLDFDYPKQFVVGLNMLQYFVFKDKHTRPQRRCSYVQWTAFFIQKV